MKYQVGRAERPQSDDERFETEAEAQTYALFMCARNEIWAVWKWENDKADTLYLVYQDDFFTRY